MGTIRADFYVGRGPGAEWLGSIARDGHPDGAPLPLLACRSEREFREAVADILDEADDATVPEMGWPWPWDDSRTTDYAYAYDAGAVWTSCYGCEWYDARDRGLDVDQLEGPQVDFPNMAARRDVAPPGSPRSGVVLVFGARR